MIDPISAAVVLAVFAAGWLTGRHARLKAAPKPPKPVLPICLCEHQYGSHDPKTGECNGAHAEWINDKQRLMSCSCLRYTGPQPVEQYWVPPAADMHIVTAPRREIPEN